jgi:hypothetical protein
MKTLLSLIALAIVLSMVAAAQSPSLYSQYDGTYLGNLSANRYDPYSTSNPYGPYGSRYSADSINNLYGMYGSRYSPYSARNPYAMQAPMIIAPPAFPLTPIPMPALRPIAPMRPLTLGR